MRKSSEIIQGGIHVSDKEAYELLAYGIITQAIRDKDKLGKEEYFYDSDLQRVDRYEVDEFIKSKWFETLLTGISEMPIEKLFKRAKL